MGWNFGFDFGIYDRLEAAIRVGDGVGIAIGDACGYLYYAVENAQLSAIRHTMTYTAENFGGTAQGTLLPLTGATGAMYDQKAPVSALVQAGWTKIDGYDAYQLVSVDGQYQFFSSYAAQSRWLEEDEARFAPSTNQIFAASTGQSELLGKWSTGAELRAALTAYAQKAAAESGDFFDVPSSHWAYLSVRWAVEQGITNGTFETTFSPCLPAPGGRSSPSSTGPITESGTMLHQGPARMRFVIGRGPFSGKFCIRRENPCKILGFPVIVKGNSYKMILRK